MKRIIILLTIIITTEQIHSQTIRALFLGNSYTYVNDLPLTISQMASSTGDALIYDSNTPGGYSLYQHSGDFTSLAKIALGNWDYVVLQEQSQFPSLSPATFQIQVFPYAAKLDSAINADNLCAETVFYMTWGRKNGDASNCGIWPPVCTYEGMDSMLNLRYQMLADTNNAFVSPVGAVWNYIRANFPSIDLYQADESHPSVAGTYAAACAFYTTLYRKDPTAITFNSSLSATDAANIRNAAKIIVYDDLMNWNIGKYDPQASFSNVGSGGNEVAFTNTSSNATTYLWFFGDGNISTTSDPVHLYAAPGSYLITLIAQHCGRSDTTYQTILAGPLGLQENENFTFSIFPNPVNYVLNVKTSSAKSMTYRILNVLGEEILEGELRGPIAIQTLPDGVYLLQLSAQNINIGQRKFIKN